MTPLTAEQALTELRKFAGIQFDPIVVDAFVQTHWVEGVSDPGRTLQPLPIPLIGQAASRMAAGYPARERVHVRRGRAGLSTRALRAVAGLLVAGEPSFVSLIGGPVPLARRGSRSRAVRARSMLFCWRSLATFSRAVREAW